MDDSPAYEVKGYAAVEVGDVVSSVPQAADVFYGVERPARVVTGKVREEYAATATTPAWTYFEVQVAGGDTFAGNHLSALAVYAAPQQTAGV